LIASDANTCLARVCFGISQELFAIIVIVIVVFAIVVVVVVVTFIILSVVPLLLPVYNLRGK
jgi:hypothetical protein